MDEFDLIARYFTPLQGPGKGVRVGIGDDAAVVEPQSGPLGIAVDTLVAGVHFPDDLAPEHIGYRAVVVNVSDFAAMAGTPRFATLALTLPEADPRWLERFADGMGEALAEYGIALVGGDTTRGPLTITVNLTGGFEGEPLRRAGARPGDLVVVTGTLGDAARGLELAGVSGARQAHEAYLTARFERPQARLALGRAIRPSAHAGIDVSDGLLADIGHLVALSGCAADIERERLPVSAQLVKSCGRMRALEFAAAGGDDYELALAVSPDDLDAARDTARKARVPLTVIGTVRPGTGVRLLDGAGLEIDAGAGGYVHFR